MPLFALQLRKKARSDHLKSECSEERGEDSGDEGRCAEDGRGGTIGSLSVGGSAHSVAGESSLAVVTGGNVSVSCGLNDDDVDNILVLNGEDVALYGGVIGEPVEVSVGSCSGSFGKSVFRVISPNSTETLAGSCGCPLGFVARRLRCSIRKCLIISFLREVCLWFA